MKMKLTAALAAMSLLLAVGAYADTNGALPGTREAEAASSVVVSAPAAAAIEEVDMEEYKPTKPRPTPIPKKRSDIGRVPTEVEVTEAYRWFVNRYGYTRGRNVRYYDNVYAYNHGDYYLTPFASKVPAEYFVMDADGILAVAPIVLDITDAMRIDLYGLDQGETAMLYGQYCERIGDGKGHVGFSGVHEGIDFVNYEGAPLYAIIGGEVINSWDSDGTVAVYNAEHDCTLLYLHCKKSFVRRGDIVEAGDLLALEGSTAAGSSYTHVEFRLGRYNTANSYRDIHVKSDCPYAFMQAYLNVQESGRQPVTASAVHQAQQLRAEAEALALAEAEALAAQQNAEPEIELVDVLESNAGYGFGNNAVIPEATLPPSK